MLPKDYYDFYWSDNGYRPLTGIFPELQAVLEAHIPPGAECLDVGCGDGQTCGPWLSRHAASYVGVDVSQTAVRKAQSLGLDVRLIDTAESLPFPNNSIDRIVCVEVLEHLFNPQRVAAEIFRVLRPEGKLIATVPNVAYWRRRFELLFGRWDPFGDDLSVEQPWRDPHIRFFTRASLARLLVTVGFSPVHIGGQLGSLLPDIPYVGRVLFVKGRRASPLYRRLESRIPALLGLRLAAVATKPLERVEQFERR